jgi:hypothetical protein
VTNVETISDFNKRVGGWLSNASCTFVYILMGEIIFNCSKASYILFCYLRQIFLYACAINRGGSDDQNLRKELAAQGASGARS